jgi:hypothetical protein
MWRPCPYVCDVVRVLKLGLDLLEILYKNLYKT